MVIGIRVRGDPGHTQSQAKSPGGAFARGHPLPQTSEEDMQTGIRKNCTIRIRTGSRPFDGKNTRGVRDRRRAFWSELERLKAQFEREHGLGLDSEMTPGLERAFVARTRIAWGKWLPEYPFPAEWAALG